VDFEKVSKGRGKMGSTEPNNTLPLDVPTRLAIERTRVAYERTIMAAVRTATSLITFGFSTYKFFQLDFLDGKKDIAGKNYSLLEPQEFGLMMIALGLLSLFLAWFEYHRDIKALRKEHPTLPRSNIGIIAGLVAVVGSSLLAMILLNI
jgi:putative membrane protein